MALYLVPTKCVSISLFRWLKISQSLAHSHLRSGLGWSVGTDGSRDGGKTVPFVEYLWRNGKLDEPLFSLTLFDQSSNPRVQGSADSLSMLQGGQLTIGGIEEDLIDEKGVTYTPLVKTEEYSTQFPSYWRANIQEVTSNNIAQARSSFDAIFQLDQSYSVLPAAKFVNILNRSVAVEIPTSELCEVGKRLTLANTFLPS